MRRRASLLIGGSMVLLAVVVLGVDELVPPAQPAPRPLPLAEVTPTSGTWTCAVGDRRDATSLQALVARPGMLGDPPATVGLTAYEDGQLRPVTIPQLFPGTHAAARVGGGEDLGLFARWSGGPAALFREWRLEGEEELPPGTVAGPCPRAIADHWVIPGLITVGGHEAVVRIANPFRTDATIAVGFMTPEGPEDPIALQNLSVPARDTIEVRVNDILPERADLSAIVTVAAGRVAVEGYQLTRSAIGDIDGASLLAAAPQPSEVWTVPLIVDTEEETSWLWVVNLGERPAPVELSLHTADGGVVPDGLAEVTVAPGQLRRIDLRGTLPEGVTSAAVTARSDGAPVYVSGVVQRRAEEVAATGFAVQLGSPAADDTWVVAGGAREGRRERLRLANPGSEPAEVDVELFNGSTAVRSSDLQDVTVPPGALVTVTLDELLTGVAHWSAHVTAREGTVVVGRHGAGGGDAVHLVATPALPAAAWSPIGGGLAARFEPGATQRLGTLLGIRATDPLAPPAEPTPRAGGDVSGIR